MVFMTTFGKTRLALIGLHFTAGSNNKIIENSIANLSANINLVNKMHLRGPFCAGRKVRKTLTNKFQYHGSKDFSPDFKVCVMDERVEEEIEALKAILMDEVIVKREGNGSAVIETDIFPATASDHSSQYVRVTLVATLPKGYPDLSPIIDLKNPRGLDDSVLQIIRREIKTKMDNLPGEPILFELIEVVREHLTEKNLPSCPCVICLYGFSEDDEFVKTQCYHYFHSYCLACHIRTAEKFFEEDQEKLPAWQRTASFQQRCPVCREVISVALETLSKAIPPVERESARNFELDENLLSLQKKMAALFKHQQSRGGIIDIEAEESKLLLVTSPVTGENETSAGPSVHSNSSASAHEVEGTNSRRGCSRGGRGHRGGFSTARKNRGHFYSASR